MSGGRETPAPGARQRNCPICGKPATSESYPFCSSRCAKVDLHRWLSGSYVIPARAEEEDDDEPSESGVAPHDRKPQP